MLRPFLFIIINTLCLLLAANVQATAYKWVDDKGVTQYSQTPPMYRKSIIIPRPAPSKMNREKAHEALLKIRQQINDRNKQRIENQRKREEEVSQQQELMKQCRQARINLESLSNNARTRYRTAEGEVIRLSDTQRKLLKQQLKEQLDTHCSSL